MMWHRKRPTQTKSLRAFGIADLDEISRSSEASLREARRRVAAERWRRGKPFSATGVDQSSRRCFVVHWPRERHTAKSRRSRRSVYGRRIRSRSRSSAARAAGRPAKHFQRTRTKAGPDRLPNQNDPAEFRQSQPSRSISNGTAGECDRAHDDRKCALRRLSVNGH